LFITSLTNKLEGVEAHLSKKERKKGVESTVQLWFALITSVNLKPKYQNLTLVSAPLSLIVWN